MDIQFILMIVVFIAALFYIGRIIYRTISQKKDSCSTGCGKCSANFTQVPTPKK